MRNLYSSIICILLMSCSNYYKSEVAVDEYHKAKFDSFLAQFAQFDGKQLDESFFELRKQFPNEKWCPEISKLIFSDYLPFYESRQGEDGFCYRPCYIIDKNRYYVVSIKQEKYKYDDNTLVTYDKRGRIIDNETVGISDNAKAYTIELSGGDNEIIYTQYCFKDIESAYDGDCDISVYKVTVDDNGKIDKQLLREEKSVKVRL